MPAAERFGEFAALYRGEVAERFGEWLALRVGDLVSWELMRERRERGSSMPLKVKAEESGRERGMSRGGRESFGDAVRGSRAGEEGADGVRMSAWAHRSDCWERGV